MNKKLIIFIIVATILAGAIGIGLGLGQTLHEAAAKGNLARVEKLLNAGGNVNAKSPEGKTPLEAALESEQTKVAMCLIGRGADVKTRNGSGYTPLLQAVSRGETAVARLLLDKGSAVNARVGSDAPACQGETPLILAVQRGDTTMIKLLLEKGADPERASYGGAKALDYANELNNSEVVELLNTHIKQKR